LGSMSATVKPPTQHSNRYFQNCKALPGLEIVIRIMRLWNETAKKAGACAPVRRLHGLGRKKVASADTRYVAGGSDARVKI
jgi:hypothetical protein